MATGGKPDQEAVLSLLEELAILRRLRHPAFLEVMAACHVTSPAPDHVTLVFQHVPLGSLHHHLHVMVEQNLSILLFAACVLTHMFAACILTVTLDNVKYTGYVCIYLYKISIYKLIQYFILIHFCIYLYKGYLILLIIYLVTHNWV